MRKLEDLTGQVFGRLTVVERAVDHIQPNGKSVTKWKCRCNCKTENPNYIIVGSSVLKSGRSISCGCYAREKSRVDLIGKKFGKLTVVSFFGINEASRTLWNCQCDCGSEEIILSSARLNSGKKKDCGCVPVNYHGDDPEVYKKYNRYDISGEYGIGYTSNNEPFYFDLEDYEKIKNYCWHYTTHKYVTTSTTNEKKGILMHRLIMNCPRNRDVDHIYHVTHDNRKSQLRIVTKSQNSMNTLLSNNNTSGYKGVSSEIYSNKWYAMITINGNTIRKVFERKEDAVEYRKLLEEKYHGEYALKEDVMVQQ